MFHRILRKAALFWSIIFIVLCPIAFATSVTSSEWDRTLCIIICGIAVMPEVIDFICEYIKEDC